MNSLTYTIFVSNKGILTSLAMILGAEEQMLGLAEKPEPNFHNKMSLQQNEKGEDIQRL